MTAEKLLEVIAKYEELLVSIGAVAQRNEEPQYLLETHKAHHHLLWMCGQMRELIAQNRPDKVMRWLGFMQGALWALRWRTLEQMKQDNMPPDTSFDASRV